MDSVILHCDMNSFYASVELLDYPELKGKPVAVCGDPKSRHGIILAKNEEAKAFGIITAETVWSAKNKCPELFLLKAHHKKYSKFCKLINDIYYDFTDLVEPFSIDESWLDVTGSQGIFGTGEEIANKIRKRVRAQLGLTMSIGVSFNKVFSKMGSDYKKPEGLTVITRENYKDLLWVLPIEKLLFVGKATGEKLRSRGIDTVGDLANYEEGKIILLLGKTGELLHEYANGIDNSLVQHAQERRRIKTVGNGVTFQRNIKGEKEINIGVIALADTVASRLRKYGLKCKGVKVDIKDPDFKIISRQKQLDFPTNLTEEIINTAMNIIKNSWNMDNPIRLLTLTAINLTDMTSWEQLSFFPTGGGFEGLDREKEEAIDKTVDKIREKFGSKSIIFASILDNDIGIDLD